MSEEKFKIFWKGKICAELDASELSEALKFGKIGLFHQIECRDGTRKTLKVFLNQTGGTEALEARGRKALAKKSEGSASKQEDSKKNKAPSNMESLTAYTVSGLCFLSPYVLTATFALDLYLIKDGYAKLALSSTLLGIILSLLGTLFFGTLFGY